MTVPSRESLSQIVVKSSQLQHLQVLLKALLLLRFQSLILILESKLFRMKRKRNNLKSQNLLHLNRQLRSKDLVLGLHRQVGDHIQVIAVRRDAKDRRELIRRARKLRNTRKSIIKNSDRDFISVLRLIKPMYVVT